MQFFIFLFSITVSLRSIDDVDHKGKGEGGRRIGGYSHESGGSS
jgi:hypothetical protein